MIKWVARLAFITALLGLIGTIIILLNIPAKQDDKKRISVERKQVESKSSKADTQVVVQPAQVPAPPPAKPPVTEKKADTIAAISPPKKETEENVLMQNNKTATEVKTTATTAGSNKTLKQTNNKKASKEILFNKDELQYLLRRLYLVKLKRGLYSNCVQLNITDEGNSKRRLSQVEKYLRRHNFTITGREVIEKKVKGFQISREADCMKLIIGSFSF